MISKTWMVVIMWAAAILGAAGRLFAGQLSVEAATGPNAGLIVSGIFFATSSLAHAIYTLGERRAFVFLVTACVAGYLLEVLSIATCEAQCYSYSAAMGVKLGTVPLLIPLGWFNSAYVAHCLVNLVAEGDTRSVRGGPGWIVGLAVTTAFVQTAWDLAGDPTMVEVFAAWSWHPPGAFFGIPFSNYQGWLELGLLVALIYRFSERALPLQPMGPVSRWLGFVPVTSYLISGATELVLAPETTRLIAVFALGPVSLIAAWKALTCAPLPARVAS